MSAIRVAGGLEAGELVALAGEQVVAVARGGFAAHGYRVYDLDGDASAGIAALLAHLVAALPGERIELAVGGGAHDAALRAHGFELLEERVHYAGALVWAGDAPEVAGVELRAVDRAGLREALAVIVAPGELARLDATASELVDELCEQAASGVASGGAVDSSLWVLAWRAGVVVGVALANRYPDGVGGITYLGVVPAERGRGLGDALHRAALHQLALAGAQRYADITAADNAPMRALIERAGAREVARRWWWIRRRPRRAARYPAFAALVDELRAHGHEVELRDPAGWLRVRWRAAREVVAVDVAWSREAQLVHVLHDFEVEVPVAALPALTTALTAANARLDVCGFALDSERRSLRYQITLWPDADGGLDGETLRRAAALVARTAGKALRAWDSLLRGSPEAEAWATPWID